MSLKRVISNVGHLTRTPLALPRGRYGLQSCPPRLTISSAILGVYSSYSTAPQPVVESRTYETHLNHHELFVKAFETKQTDLARRALLTLLNVSEGRQEPLDAYGLSKSGLVSLMSLLLFASRTADLRIIEQILECMESKWNFPVHHRIHTMIIRHLVRRGEVLSAVRWLSHMQDKPGNCTSMPKQWHMVLEKCRQDDKTALAHSTVRSMRQSGCPTTEETYKILFGAMFSPSGVPQFPQVRTVIHEMLEDKVSFTAQLRDNLMTNYRDRGHILLSARVEQHWETVNALRSPQNEDSKSTDTLIPTPVTVQGSNPDSALTDGPPNTTSVDASRTAGKEAKKSDPPPVQESEDSLRKAELMADLLGEENGKRKTMVLLKQYTKQGFEPTSSTLTVMSRSISNLKDLQFWQKTLRVDIETEVFAHLIRNARTPFHALAAYRNALQYTPPTLTLLHPLIKYLQNTNHGKPSKETIDTALRMHATYVTSRNESGAGLDLEQPRKTSELVTYNILLRMLSSSSLADTYTSQTLDLVQEIRNRGLQMSGPVTASLIITLMKSSTKLQDAFQFYRIAYKDREGRLLLESSENFAHVIKAFTDLPFANGLASVAYHFDFIQDIRDAKLPLTAEIYTILLKYYARSAIGLPENDLNTRQKLATVIRRLHDMITVDASLVPDIAMWNQLMDSYQRVGYFQDAIQLWKTMFIARKFDHASVSVVTDACAFAGAHQVAVDIYKQLHEAQFRLNRRNWINWLECLCRLGKFDEALKFVCLQMGKDEHSVAPDADVVKLMLKFAIQENRVGEARTKLKTYLPDVWNSLPKDIKNF